MRDWYTEIPTFARVKIQSYQPYALKVISLGKVNVLFLIFFNFTIAFTYSCCLGVKFRDCITIKRSGIQKHQTWYEFIYFYRHISLSFALVRLSGLHAHYTASSACLISAQLHFPTPWIFLLGLSPWHSRHQWSCINASHWPFTVSSLPVIGKMSSTNINITWVCESAFLQGARKWMKTWEPIMFCYSSPFTCSSLAFCIRRRLARLIAGLTGCWSSAVWQLFL